MTVYQEGTPWYPHHNFLKSPRISGISLRLAESTPLLSIPVLSLNALFAALDCSLRTANGKRPRHGTEGMGHGQNSWELGGICIYLYMNLYEHVPTARLKLFFLWLCVLCRQFCWHQQVRSTFMKKASPYLALFNLPILKLSRSTYSVYI